MSEEEKFTPEEAEQFHAPETGKPEEPTELPETQDTEFQLTPEIEEKIMEKVKDIDAYGTAFSSLSFMGSLEPSEIISRLKDTLQYGFLGSSGRGNETAMTERERLLKWHHDARSWNIPESKVWFNIVGRMSGILGKNQIDKSHMVSINGVAIVFDISNFKEMPVETIRNIHQMGRPEQHVVGTFSADTDRKVMHSIKEVINQVASKTTNKEYRHFSHKVDEYKGFHTPFRIAPRLFQGLVVDVYHPNVLASYLKAMQDTYQDKPEMSLPIYDTFGNLLWPRQITHKEIKQLVAERDKKQIKK